MISAERTAALSIASAASLWPKVLARWSIVVLGEEAGLHQLVAAVEVRTRIVERGDVALRLRLGLVESGLVIAVVDLVEQSPPFTSAPSAVAALDVAGDLGLKRDLCGSIPCARNIRGRPGLFA